MGDIKRPDGKLDMDEIRSMLKKLATILMLDGLKETDTEKITLSNSLGIILATLDLGPAHYIDLMKALGPQSKKIAAEIEKKNPRLADLNAVRPDELFTKDGGVNKEALMEVMLKNVDIKDALKGTGAHESNGFVFEPKKDK